MKDIFKFFEKPTGLTKREKEEIQSKLEETKSRELWGTNREEKRKPKKGKFWCPGCDMNLISEGRKCKICSVKDMRKRNRK